MKSVLTVVSFAVLILNQGCYYDNEEELYRYEDQISDLDCEQNEVSFARDIFPLIQAKCAISGCHVQDGGNGIPYESYNQVKDKIDSGVMRPLVIDSQEMPPEGASKLGNCELSMFTLWLDSGAPNN